MSDLPLFIIEDYVIFVCTKKKNIDNCFVPYQRYADARLNHCTFHACPQFRSVLPHPIFRSANWDHPCQPKDMPQNPYRRRDDIRSRISRRPPCLVSDRRKSRPDLPAAFIRMPDKICIPRECFNFSVIPALPPINPRAASGQSALWSALV